MQYSNRIHYERNEVKGRGTIFQVILKSIYQFKDTILSGEYCSTQLNFIYDD